MSMRVTYIAGFIILGYLCSLLVHAGVEMILLELVVQDYATYGTMWWWQNWDGVHAVGSLVIAILGLGLGYWGGRYFWQAIYVEGRYRPNAKKI